MCRDQIKEDDCDTNLKNLKTIKKRETSEVEHEIIQKLKECVYVHKGRLFTSTNSHLLEKFTGENVRYEFMWDRKRNMDGRIQGSNSLYIKTYEQKEDCFCFTREFISEYGVYGFDDIYPTRATRSLIMKYMVDILQKS